MKNKASTPSPLSKREVAELAAQKGAEVALETYEKERKRRAKEADDRRLHNTKLLLRNYRLLKLHTSNSISDPEQACEDETIADVLQKIWAGSEQGYDDIYIDSIRKSATRTLIIVRHVEEMFGIYEAYCVKSKRLEEMRRYRVIKALYIDDQQQSVREVADIEQIDTRTVYKDVDAACIPLSALIFGIGGLRR